MVVAAPAALAVPAAVGAGGAKTAGAALTQFASAAALASAGLGAASAIARGREAQAAADFNAQRAEQEAARERRDARREAEDFRRRQNRTLASSRATRAGAGVAADGTPLLVDEATAAEIELGARTLLTGGNRRANRRQEDAALSRFRGRTARSAGDVRAARTLLTGARVIGSRFA
ncbi:MAG: hypothetical protein QNJ94_22485 [Alphaproteobacteria bacterium]|nr:hypothetical protein [Alphaproteobacteria bacterium]